MNQWNGVCQGWWIWFVWWLVTVVTGSADMCWSVLWSRSGLPTAGNPTSKTSGSSSEGLILFIAEVWLNHWRWQFAPWFTTGLMQYISFHVLLGGGGYDARGDAGAELILMSRFWDCCVSSFQYSSQCFQGHKVSFTLTRSWIAYDRLDEFNGSLPNIRSTTATAAGSVYAQNQSDRTLRAYVYNINTYT